jgi:predicted SAM-dependent methyltransferase
MSKAYLNVGCGNRYLKGWTNIDFRSSDKSVISHNLLTGLPFEERAFELVYHSHVLEHFDKKQGAYLIRECFRVLQSGGIIRIAVPDLSKIAAQYLSAKQRYEELPNQDNLDNYRWAHIVMIDQMVRKNSGGEMLQYLKSDPNNLAFVAKTNGSEMLDIIQMLKKQKHTEWPNGLLAQVKRIVGKIKRQLIYAIEPKLKGQMDVVVCRSSGEVHQWMYDEVSLRVLMEETGFNEIRKVEATESAVPAWSSFNLDTEVSGELYKPESLFMEARKV